MANPKFRADVVERIAALHRIGEPMDLAGAVVFLASPAASLITGHTMLIDGGWTARYIWLPTGAPSAIQQSHAHNDTSSAYKRCAAQAFPEHH